MNAYSIYLYECIIKERPWKINERNKQHWSQATCTVVASGETKYIMQTLKALYIMVKE